MTSNTESRSTLRRPRSRAMRTLAVVAVMAATLALDGATASATSPPSDAIQAAHIRYPLQNWDHDPNKNDVNDNPVSIIFVSNNAGDPAFEQIFHSGMASQVYDQVSTDEVHLNKGGDPMWLSGVGGSRPGVNPTDPWISHSAGRKGALSCWGQCEPTTDIHLRLYGPDGHWGTQVYQGNYGYRPYYLLATVHFDKNEGDTDFKDFGYQDQARELLVGKLVSLHKWTVLDKSVNVQNKCYGRPLLPPEAHHPEPYHDPHHYCFHDGKAWIVSIDG